MDYLPKDPAILVSSVNMLLRDKEFDSFDALCYSFSRDPKQIKDYLYKRGFVWSEQQKQGKGHKTGSEPGVYQCGDHQLEGKLCNEGEVFYFLMN